MTLTVSESGVRLDVFAATQSGLTRSRIKNLLEAGSVLLNGKRVKSGAILRAGDVVTLEVSEPPPCKATAEDIPLSIVYEDESLAVIDKPQGMTVHPAAGNYSGTLVNALLWQFRNLSGVSGEVRPGIVHRLDKDTSGLLIVAKTDAAHLALSADFAAKRTERVYQALCEGHFRPPEGTIDKPVGRDRNDRKKMAVVGNGRRAVTHYKALCEYKSFTFAQFILGTGRTHQIRVHCKFLGHPVVGDKTYGFKKQHFNLRGQLLHSHKLTFTHPVSGERMTFTSPLPPYFQEVLDKLQ